MCVFAALSRTGSFSLLFRCVWCEAVLSFPLSFLPCLLLLQSLWSSFLHIHMGLRRAWAGLGPQAGEEQSVVSSSGQALTLDQLSYVPVPKAELCQQRGECPHCESRVCVSFCPHLFSLLPTTNTPFPRRFPPLAIGERTLNGLLELLLCAVLGMEPRALCTPCASV